MIQEITVTTDRQGLFEITPQVERVVSQSKVGEGLCVVFLRHTSASLIIQENADPSARFDLEVWLNRLVPDGQPGFTHTMEGADDMPAHIKSALTGVSLSIPIFKQRLSLGTWQGIYLWEHRHRGDRRSVIVQVSGDAL